MYCVWLLLFGFVEVHIKSDRSILCVSMCVLMFVCFYVSVLMCVVYMCDISSCFVCVCVSVCDCMREKKRDSERGRETFHIHLSFALLNTCLCIMGATKVLCNMFRDCHNNTGRG